MKNILLLIFICLVISTKLFSQENNTLYFMQSVPQANITNPALQCNCKFNLSGIFTLPINVNVSNTGFNFSDLIHYGTGSMSDSLVFDVKKVISKLQKNNFLFFDFNQNLLTAGYKLKDFYFTFSITDKLNFRFNYPRDFIKFADEGNGLSFMGQTADFNGLGFSINYYREYAFGVSLKIDKNLTVGIKPKILFGKFNVYTSKTDITDYTSPSDFENRFHANMVINSSQPFVNFNNIYYNYKTMEVDGNVTGNNSSLKQVILNNHNMGLGLDMGATYKLINHLTLYGSIIDLGFIKWKENVNTFVTNGDYSYDGLNYLIYNQNSTSLSHSYGQRYLDSLLHIFNPQIKKNSYISYLTAKLFIGGEYSFNDKLSFSLLSKSEVVLGTVIPSFTLSALGTLTNRISACLSYSYINHSFLNAGAGIMVKAGVFQMYAVTDNLIAVFLPLQSRNVNLNFGFNLLFGCPKKKNTGNTYL